MADNPYAEFQQDSTEQAEKPAVKKPASSTGDNPYAEFQQDAIPAEQPKAEEEPGIASKAWQAVNKPTYTPSEEEQNAYMKAKNYSTSVPTQEESKSPIWTGIKKGAAGAYADTADTLRGLTSPVGMATMAAPGVEGVGAIGKTAGALGKIAGIGFGAQGAREAYEGGKDVAENVGKQGGFDITEPTKGMTPENTQKTLQGAGQAVMGATAAMHGVTPEGMKETATAPLRAGARVINAAKNNPEVTGAIAGGAAGLTHGPVGVGIGAIEGGRGGGMINRFLKKVPDLNERVGMRPTEEQRNLVGNEYTPPAKAPVPPARTGTLPRIEYAEPTPHTPADLVGNEYTPETSKPVSEAAPTPKGALGRIEYAEPTPTKAEGLVGNEYTEGENPKVEAKGKNPISGIEYAEPTEHTKDITAEDVKSTPGTSMSPEGKAKAAGDSAHVEKAKSELGEAAPTGKVLDRANQLKEEAQKNHEATLGNKPAGKPVPEAKEITKVANDYNQQTGKPPISDEKVGKDPRSPQIADAYDAMKHDPNNPEVKKSYDALIKDTMDQFHHLLSEGYKFDTSPEDPYQGADASKQMLDDIHNNKHLSVWEGGAPPEDHPLSGIDPETGKSYNSIFRFVHDIMGHGAGDNDFSQVGEENAYNRHAKSYSPEAIPALTTETKGQTSHYFDNAKVRGGAPHEFAEQKAALLPEEFYAKPEPTAIERERKITPKVDLERQDQIRQAEFERQANRKDIPTAANFKGKTVRGADGFLYSTIGMTPEQIEDIQKPKGEILPPEGKTYKSEPAQVSTAEPEKILEHIGSGKDHAIITAENPNNGRLSDEENAKLNDTLKKDLIEKGYKPVDVAGHNRDVEGEKEHSFYVPDIKPEDAAELGRKYGQESVLTKEGLHHLADDTINPVKQGAALMTDEEARKQPYYSNIGGKDFSVPIDFDKTVKPGEALKDNKGATEESKVTPEDVSTVNNVVKDLADQDIIKAGSKYDVDHGEYDFKKRDENRHRTERDQYAKDVTAGIPDEMKQKLVKAAQEFDDKDSYEFDEPSRSSMSRAARAKAIWDRAHESPTEAQASEKMKAKGPAPEASDATARMSDAELLKHGFTQEDIDAGKQFPEVGGGEEGKSLAAEKGIPEAFAKNMTPDEIASVTKKPKATEAFLNTMSKIPDVQEYTDIALAGEGARKWYQRSASAFDAMKEEAPKYFDQEGDKEKFIGLLASSSPRQSVAMNMRETLGAWKAYIDAGRPEGEALKGLLKDNFTLPNTKIPNAMKALAGEKLWPDLTKNTAFKAPSFERNLRGWLDYSTNDGWMALFGGLDPGEISKATSYHPLSIATRAAAKALGWETAEAQAAIWSFTQALTERGEELPEEIRRQSEDFADILAHDPQTRELVSDLGVNLDQLDTRLKAIGEKPEVTGRTTGTTSRSIGKLKGRIEEARGKGTIPPPKSAQGSLGFREPHAIRAEVEPSDTSFNPEEFSEMKTKGERTSALGKIEEPKAAPKAKPTSKPSAIPLNKLYDRSAVLVSPEGKLMSIPEYDPRSESPQHPELLRKSGYKGDLTKFLKEGGVRAYTTGPEEAGVEIQNDSPETIQRALRVVDGLDREKTTFEIADPKTFKTKFSKTGTYSQIKNALDNR